MRILLALLVFAAVTLYAAPAHAAPVTKRSVGNEAEVDSAVGAATAIQRCAHMINHGFRRAPVSHQPDEARWKIGRVWRSSSAITESMFSP